jgi:prepilin-type N-terminal cleavage/methylation domain-containing protein
MNAWRRAVTGRGGGARRSAFTLIEVLAALVLTAIILPVAMSGISLALSTAENAALQTEAAALAQTKMAEIVATGDWQNASLSGDFGTERPEFRWTSVVTDWQGTTLRQLDVEVSWTRRGRDRSVVLSTLIYTGASE